MNFNFFPFYSRKKKKEKEEWKGILSQEISFSQIFLTLQENERKLRMIILKLTFNRERCLWFIDGIRIYFSIQQKIKFQYGSQGFKKTDDLASHVLSDSEIKKNNEQSTTPQCRNITTFSLRLHNYYHVNRLKKISNYYVEWRLLDWRRDAYLMWWIVAKLNHFCITCCNRSLQRTVDGKLWKKNDNKSTIREWNYEMI